MDKELYTSLRAFVEAYATQSTENSDQLIHEYICKKSQSMLLGEAKDEDKADEDKDEDKDETDEKDEKSKSEKDKDEDKDEDDEKDESKD